MLKLYFESAKAYFAISAAARRHGLLFGGHLATVTPLAASDSETSIIDHFWGSAILDDDGDLSDQSGGLAPLVCMTKRPGKDPGRFCLGSPWVR